MSYFSLTETIAANIHVKLVGDGLHIAAYRVVAGDAQSCHTAMAHIEMYLGMCLKCWLAVGSEDELGGFHYAVFRAQRLLQQQIYGEGEPTVEVMAIAQRLMATLTTYELQRLGYVDVVYMVVKIEQGEKLRIESRQ